jgi:NhaP-type Na+/H+ and K+/H+ antiporter
LINQLRLGHDGLYPVLTMAMALFTYAFTDWIGGSGFLAVYLAGIVLSRHDFIHKRSLVRFHDGLAWLVQIVMFLTLGLLVFPSRLIRSRHPWHAAGAGTDAVARPAGVLISLFNSSFDWRKKPLSVGSACAAQPRSYWQPFPSCGRSSSGSDLSCDLLCGADLRAAAGHFHSAGGALAESR